jgi:PKD repeat protein
MKKKRFILGALALFAAACNSTNPVAPNPQTPGGGTGGGGTGSYTITLQPSSLTATVGATTPVAVAISVKRSDTSAAPPAGTKIALSTDLGSFGTDGAGKPLQLQSLTLDATGQAQTGFFPGSAMGTAHILAQVDTSTAKLNLTVQDPVVVPFFVTSVTPNFGSPTGGTVVTITGSGFLAPVRVAFGTVVATVTDVSDKTIHLLSPRPATPVDVGTTLVVDLTVTNNLAKTPVTDTLTGAYTYVNGPSLDRPIILSVVPPNGPNAGGTQVDIHGSGFDSDRNALQVFFGLRSASGFDGVPATVLSATKTDIQVSSPNAATLGPSLLNQQVDILVRNLTTGFETTAVSAFKYEGTQIAATSMSPTSGPYTGGTLVTIQGQGFVKPVEVQFGGVTQTVDQSTVTVRRILATTVPVAVSDCKPPSGPLTIKNLNTGEMATTGFLFSYTVPVPVILQVSPVAGKQAGGDTVTITGKDFESNVRVEFGGIAAVTPQVAPSGASLTAQTPAFTGAFDSVPCDDNGDGQMGLKYRPKAVDVKVTSLATGCTDTFALAFSYNPTDTSCRGDVKATQPPVADFVFAANFLTVAFSDRSTGGAPTSWKWDFGDGAMSTVANPTHTYAQAGSYLVQLTATNSAGSSSIAKQIKVVALKADFNFSADNPDSPRMITFTDHSTGPPAAWSWSFGDGATSTAQNPTHTYTNPGTYFVFLTVTSGSMSDTTNRQVAVP